MTWGLILEPPRMATCPISRDAGMPYATIPNDRTLVYHDKLRALHNLFFPCHGIRSGSPSRAIPYATLIEGTGGFGSLMPSL
jgi:hypothetical protein